MRAALRSALLALALLAIGRPGAAAPVGLLGDFNVLVWGDFTAQYSDVQGRLAAGGNVSLNGYSVGDQLTGDLVGGDTLVAGGNITFPSGRVYHGDIVAGGSTAGIGSPVLNGMAPYDVRQGLPPPVDFAAERARLTAASATLSMLAPTGTDNYQWSQLFLTGSGAATEVFDISAYDLGRATNIVVGNVAEGASVVINVHGATASMSGGMDAFFERNRDHVLFNFVDATALSLANIGVQGSILAPVAHIQTGWGVIWGQVAAASWNGPMQVNSVYYDGTLPSPEPVGDIAIAAPGALGGFALGLLAIAVSRGRKAGQPA